MFGDLRPKLHALRSVAGGAPSFAHHTAPTHGRHGHQRSPTFRVSEIHHRTDTPAAAELASAVIGPHFPRWSSPSLPHARSRHFLPSHSGSTASFGGTDPAPTRPPRRNRSPSRRPSSALIRSSTCDDPGYPVGTRRRESLISPFIMHSIAGAPTSSPPRSSAPPFHRCGRAIFTPPSEFAAALHHPTGDHHLEHPPRGFPSEKPTSTTVVKTLLHPMSPLYRRRNLSTIHTRHSGSRTTFYLRKSPTPPPLTLRWTKFPFNPFPTPSPQPADRRHAPVRPSRLPATSASPRNPDGN